MLSAVLSLLARFQSWSLQSWVSVIVIGVLSAVLYEQLSYMIKRGALPGPKFTVPFLGGIVHMVTAPFDFWHSQMKYGKLSWNSIIGQYFVMCADSECTRKVFENCSEQLPLALHPNAYRLLGRDNIAFLNGPGHKALRASLLPLFSQKALSTYLSIQEKAIRESLREWSQSIKQSGDNGLEMRTLIYDLNTHTSMSVFMGPYLTTSDRKQFQHDYSSLTQGMYAFPFYFPGTQLWTAAKSRATLLENLSRVSRACKDRMRRGEEPVCLLDFWMTNLVKEIDLAAKTGAPAPDHSSDLEVAKITLDFLFASQDASTSSLTFAVHELCKHPEVLRRLKEEQARVRPNKDAPITQETLNELKFTWQVMKELLRLRPPATIVPHITKEPFQLDANYTAPAGTLVVPSIWSSNRVGFPDPEAFDPDRFGEERKEHLKFEKQFLTFGAGPHSCMGQRYAMNHIMLFMSLLSDYEIERKQTPNIDDTVYLPTIYPADGCIITKLKL